MPATVWKGHLTFGLVSIPIKLHRASRAEKVSFRHVYRRAGVQPPPEPDGETESAPPPRKGGKLLPIRQAAAPAPEPAIEAVERVRQVALPQEGDEPLEHREIVKGYEYEKDRYVLIDPEELKRLQPETAREMQLREFVRLADIDPVYFESSYYAWPDRGGEKPYTLLLEALRGSGYVGVAEVAMQRREHVVIVRPGHSGLVLHTMFYTPEIHAEDEYRADTAVNDRELELAQMLIGNLAAPFEPQKYRDRYKERVEELIEAKLAGREIAQTATATAAKAPVVDMMEALRRSLEATTTPAARKPAAADRRKPKAKRA